MYVLLHNSAGLLLLQKRSARKAVFPNTWDLTCAEHVQPGESYEAAALRGLREELSIPPPPALLRTLAPTRRTLRAVCARTGARVLDNEFVPLYEGLYDGSSLVDAAEVSAVRWVNWQQLLAEVAADEGAFTPWLVETLRLLGRIA